MTPISRRSSPTSTGPGRQRTHGGPERPALAPTRERGRRRLEAILAAASEVFVERGIGAATMAEIASRSSSHVGSLYRFFPTKEAVVDALLERYVARVRDVTSRLLARADALSAPAFAAAFLDLMLDLRQERALAMQLADASGLDGDRRRHVVSDMMFQACEQGVRAVIPVLTASRAVTVAQMLLYFGKIVIIAAEDGDAGRPDVVTELRSVASRYMADQAGTKAV